MTKTAPMTAFQSNSEDETIALAEALAKRLRGGDVLALNGPLGSGKTCFVRGLVRGLQLDEQAVSSPTFLICQEYQAQTDHADSVSLAHLDAYRLRDPDDLDSIGWDELLADARMIIAVEWADRIEADLPERYFRLEFEHITPAQRSITIESVGFDAQWIADLQPVRQHGQDSPCPICSTSVNAQADSFPFCSQRCRMVDLGKWFSGSRVITRPLREDDFEQM